MFAQFEMGKKTENSVRIKCIKYIQSSWYNEITILKTHIDCNSYTAAKYLASIEYHMISIYVDVKTRWREKRTAADKSCRGRGYQRAIFAIESKTTQRQATEIITNQRCRYFVWDERVVESRYS
jgi:hypothetical protein